VAGGAGLRVFPFDEAGDVVGFAFDFVEGLLFVDSLLGFVDDGQIFGHAVRSGGEHVINYKFPKTVTINKEAF